MTETIVIAPELAIWGAADDKSLAERILRGDRAAENQLIARYSDHVFAMVMLRIQDRDNARELVDDVMMATVIALRRGTVHDTARLAAFVHGTMLNLVHNYLRKRFRMPRTQALRDQLTSPDLAETCEWDSNLRELRSCVARLQPLESQILFMSLVEGLGPSDIATRLGVTAEVVRKRKSRALKRLKESLREPSRRNSSEPLSGR